MSDITQTDVLSVFDRPIQYLEAMVKAKLCSEDEERLDRLEALMTKIAEKLEIQP